MLLLSGTTSVQPGSTDNELRFDQERTCPPPGT